MSNRTWWIIVINNVFFKNFSWTFFNVINYLQLFTISFLRRVFGLSLVCWQFVQVINIQTFPASVHLLQWVWCHPGLRGGSAATLHSALLHSALHGTGPMVMAWAVPGHDSPMWEFQHWVQRVFLRLCSLWAALCFHHSCSLSSPLAFRTLDQIHSPTALPNLTLQTPAQSSRQSQKWGLNLFPQDLISWICAHAAQVSCSPWT